MGRTRKLFPIYGSALANNLLAAVGRGGAVHDFIAGYENRYRRPGILGSAGRERELVDTMGREIILAMIVEVHHTLPRFFGKTKLEKLKEDEKKAVDAFESELFAALGRAWDWQEEDRSRFGHDLTLYSDFAARRISAGKTKNKRRKLAPEESPFVGRVALLLDPSMMEQARRASAKFHGELACMAQKLLRQTLRPGGR
jgi:hypothetical protein